MNDARDQPWFIQVRTRDTEKTGFVFVCEHVSGHVYKQYASCHEDEAEEMIRALISERTK